MVVGVAWEVLAGRPPAMPAARQKHLLSVVRELPTARTLPAVVSKLTGHSEGRVTQVDVGACALGIDRAAVEARRVRCVLTHLCE